MPLSPVAENLPARTPTPLKRVAEDLTVGGRKKQRTVDTDLLAFWVALGCAYAREFNFLDAWGKIMEAGMQLVRDIEDAEDAGEDLVLDGISRRIVRSWRAACATIELRSPTALLDVGLAKQITTKMDEGVTKAKTADTRTMKTYVPGLLAKLYGVLDPPLYGSEKAGRGYTHRVTAKLLFPVTLPFTEDNRLALLNKQIAVPGDVFPRFLYRNMDIFDTDKNFLEREPWTGFFKSEILLKFFKLIFTSPSSADKENMDECTATRKGNAAIANMTEVTVGSLAYIAAHLRFALSSGTRFSRTDPNTDVEGFYGSLYTLFTDPIWHDEVEQLLQWWNRRLFPNSAHNSILSAGSTMNFFNKKAAELRAAA